MRARGRLRYAVVVTAALLGTLLPATPVRAATITVTTTSDDFNSDPATCSLREAVHSANANVAFGGCLSGSGADQITLPAGTYQFSRSGTESLADVSVGDLDVDGHLTIVGQGHPTIDANDLDRIFEVNGDGTDDALILRGLTLTDGYAVEGGAIRLSLAVLFLTDVVVDLNTASDATNAAGGGIWASKSSILIATSQITRNMATASPTFPSYGGGIWASDTGLRVSDSVIDSNTADESGGGVQVFGESTLGLANVTITSNKARDGDGIFMAGSVEAHLWNVTIAFNGQAASGKGGGLYANPSPGYFVKLESVTFSNNLAGDGGSVYLEPSTMGGVNAKNTIAAHPLAGGNCGGKSISSTNGHNLEWVPGGTASPCFTSTDPTTVNGDPKFPLDAVTNVAPPADNGGPTPTVALGAGSAAIDAGITEFGVVRADQRGVLRPVGAAPDIGAYERILCRGVLVNRVGTAGNDSITGTSGPDGILGLGGNDRINGLGGHDGLCGGPGNDRLDGGLGNDFLEPGTGLDRVIGGSNSDTVSYAASARAVSVDLRLGTALASGQGRDTISGVENVVGTRFADVIRGNGSANWLRLMGGGDSGYGYGGVDRIDGGSGSDRLFGGTGNDQLFGEAGNDFFNGESGRDLCRQGPGSGRRISCERR